MKNQSQNDLIKYIIKRLLQAVFTFWGIITIVFFIIHIIPVDPIQMQQGGIMNKSTDTQMIEEIKKLYNLDKPIYIQYGLWIKNIVKLDFGRSLHDDRDVITRIGETLPITITLNLISIILSILLAIPIGIISAIKHKTILDRTITVLLFILYALPVYWVALMLLSIFGVRLDILPISGIRSDNYEYLGYFERLFDMAKHLAIPVLCYTYGSLTFLSRITKGSFLDTLSSDYIRTAFAGGLSTKAVVIKHALRNSLIPIVTIFSTLLPALLGGSIIIEKIFQIPGMGQLMFDSIRSFDYPVIMASLFFSAFLTLINILIIDISYIFINPRISYQAKG